MAKILLIEDDAAIAAIERDYLEMEHFEVEIAADGNAGRYRQNTRSGTGSGRLH